MRKNALKISSKFKIFDSMVQISTLRSVDLFEHIIKVLLEVVFHWDYFIDQTFNFDNALNNNLGFHLNQNVF